MKNIISIFVFVFVVVSQYFSIEEVNPPVLSHTTTITNVLCFQQCNGIIEINSTGGTGTIQYSIDNGVTFSTNNVFNGLCAGTYDIVVEDAAFTRSASTEIVGEPTILSSVVSVYDATCTGCNGSANISVSGGVMPYSYSWFGVGSSPTSNNNWPFCAGSFPYEITDANGCVIFDSIAIIDQPSPVIDTITFIEPLCYNSSTASATVVASGGTITAGYMYQWNDPSGQTAQTAVALTDGLYCVQIMDDNGCVVSQCVNVTEPAELIIQIDSSSTICYGDSTQILASGVGGTIPYTFNWANPAIVGPGPHVVAPPYSTNYCASVMDANGCSSGSYCVLVTVSPSLNLTVFGDSPICEGVSSNISTIASGGDGGPYTYTWDQGVGIGQNQTVSPTQSTVYTITVTDGCSTPSVSAQVHIEVNTVPLFGGTVSDEMFGADGAIDLYNVPAGSTFDWDNDGVGDFDDTENLTGLTAGNYTVSLMTVEGCLGLATFTVGSQVGIEELLNSGDVLIHPNPNNGSFSIDVKNSVTINSMKIIDVNGSVIFHKEKAFNSVEKIEISEPTNGLYFLVVETEQGNYYKRIVVIR